MAAPAPTIITDLLDAVVARLKDAPEFIAPDVEVISDREDGIETKIINALSKAMGARAGGLCVIVGTTFRIGEGRILTARLNIDIQENSLLNHSANGTKIAGADAGFVVLMRLVGWSPSSEDVDWSQCDEPNRGDQFSQIANNNGLLSYRAVVECSTQLRFEQ